MHTSWINPNEEYDAAVREFTARILDNRTGGPFLKDFRPFQRKISHFGLLNSLAQTLLKFTLPGVPDTYQGTELWDFSLVDPDNRRPVDFVERARLLQELRSKGGSNRAELAAELLHSKENGRVKLYVTERGAALSADASRPVRRRRLPAGRGGGRAPRPCLRLCSSAWHGGCGCSRTAPFDDAMSRSGWSTTGRRGMGRDTTDYSGSRRGSALVQCLHR